MKYLYVVILLFLSLSGSLAVEPDELLLDPVLEARARYISGNLRCVVCQNEPIDTSNASVARDLRLLVRERLIRGDSDEDVYAFLVARYGDYVLFKPPWKPSTYLLWVSPFLILICACIGIVVNLRSKNKPVPKALSIDEENRLKTLLSDSDIKE